MRLFAWIWTSWLFFCPLAGFAARLDLCRVHVESAEKIDFSKTETDWLCGNPEVPGWHEIPVAQKRFFLRSFLQDRGYHSPQFRREGQEIFVAAGPLARVRSFTVSGVPPEFDAGKHRRTLGRELNPDALDDAETWTKRELQQMGYPCPKVAATSNLGVSSLKVSAEPGPLYYFDKIPSQGGADLPLEVLDRFTAYVEGQRFDIRLLELSSQRILNAGLYLSTYYDILCGEGQAPQIVRRFVPALPRLLTVGVGFDTEQGPLARARFRRMRIGRAANSFEATVLATFRQQTAETRFQWHVLKDLASPFRLIPLLAYDRESEHQYQTSTLRGGMLAATEWERPEFQLGLEAGPTLEHTTTLRGLGRRHVTTAKTNATLRGTSHLFEYYAAHPRTGWSFQVDTSSRIAGFLSHVTVHRLTLRHEWLWNWRQFDPPALIIGWRGFWGTFTARRAETLLDIPVSDRFFLGGDADIRGFGRKTIGGATNGLLSAVYQGIELRAGEWGMYPVQPLVFFDFAKGGAGEFSLGSTVYYAPGIGVRYASPIGSVRATLGRGFIADRRDSDPDPGLQFFFSLGREF